MNNPGLVEVFEYLRYIAGLIVVLFLPGYLLQIVVFPTRRDLAGYERLALSFGLSIGVVAVIAPVLDWLPWGVQMVPIGVMYLGIILLCIGLHVYQRKGMAEGNRDNNTKSGDIWSGWRKTENSLQKVFVMQVVAVLFGVGVLLINALSEHPGGAFTEFYLLGPEGMAENFPREAMKGGRMEVVCGIVNHEGAETRYRIEVRQVGKVIGEGESFDLADGEGVEVPVGFQPERGGEVVRIDFGLLRGPEKEPYRALALWLEVQETQ